MSQTFLANLFCQNCGLPVKLDPTLLDYNSLEQLSNQSKHKTANHLKELGSANIQDSFILLSQASPYSSTQPDEHRGNLSHRLKVANRLFDLISGQSKVDHPMCQDCAEEMLVKLEKRLADLRKEKDSYASYYEKMKALDISDYGRQLTTGSSQTEVDKVLSFHEAWEGDKAISRDFGKAGRRT
jgi:Beclin-1 BH3 domain, Bcl-2-interacting